MGTTKKRNFCDAACYGLGEKRLEEAVYFGHFETSALDTWLFEKWTLLPTWGGKIPLNQKTIFPDRPMPEVTKIDSLPWRFSHTATASLTHENVIFSTPPFQSHPSPVSVVAVVATPAWEKMTFSPRPGVLG